jgi:hypothetical protein
MEAGDRTILELIRENASEGQLFDELSQGIASGAISRRRALKLAGGALLAALFGSVVIDEAEAVTERRCEGKPAVSNRRCPETRSVCRDRAGQICRCALTVEGDRRCLDFTNEQCPTTDECDRSRDCPGNQYCIQIAACCFGSRRNACVRPCD